MSNSITDVRTRHKNAEHTRPPKPRGRRALPPIVTDPVNTTMLAVEQSAVPTGIRRVAVTALTAGSLMAGLGVAHATTKAQPKIEHVNDVTPAGDGKADAAMLTAMLGADATEVKLVKTEAAKAEAIKADEAVKIEQAKVEVKTVAAPAPVVEAPKPAPVVAQPVAAVAPVKVAQAQAPAPAPAVKQAPAPVAPVSAAPAGRAQVIVNAALAQNGQFQDCTRLVTRALAAAGINFHGWPAEYYSLGHAVSAAEALPGDLIFYANGGGGMAHIAVYLGNGEAMHGGYNGNQSVRWKANVPSPATAAQYIRLR